MTDAGYTLRYVWAVSFIILMIFAGTIHAQQNKETNQEKNQVKQELKNIPFVDEDGDGFNDLLPDSDGDGIPDMIDPDYKGHSAESLYMHRYMNGQTIEAERNQYQNMFNHGEPGQYGPSDSTHHGQQGGEGSGHHGGDDEGNQGGNGGDNGNGGNGGQGGNGGGGGLNAPEINDHGPATAKAQPGNNSSNGDSKPSPIEKAPNQKSGNSNGGNNQGGQGGGRP